MEPDRLHRLTLGSLPRAYRIELTQSSFERDADLKSRAPAGFAPPPELAAASNRLDPRFIRQERNREESMRPQYAPGARGFIFSGIAQKAGAIAPAS